MEPLTRCSEVRVEALPGTAKSMTTCLALEYPEHWSRDVLDGDTFGGELTGRLKRHLKASGAGLQLIRRVGRAGHGGRASDGSDSFHLYLFFTAEGVTELLKVPGPEAILDLDLSGPGRNGAMRIEHPVLLVCTHSKRDACCAIKGRPLARELDASQPREWVWESSHTKGHRFAPSMLLFPWGYSFGRLNAPAAGSLMAAAGRGELFLPGNRGRGCLDGPGQVAELAVAAALADAPSPVPAGSLTVAAPDASDAASGEAAGAHASARATGVDAGASGGLAAADAVREVAAPDGRRWRVVLGKVTYDGVVSSCGDEPKRGKGWRALAVEPL